jgi:hypothetical protein
MALDPELQYDSAQMAILKDSPGWQVYLKYLHRQRDGALAQAMEPSISDQATHHFRGVYLACVDHSNIPDDVIRHEKESRIAQG